MRSLILATLLALSGCGLYAREAMYDESVCDPEAPQIESADCWPSNREVTGAFD